MSATAASTVIYQHRPGVRVLRAMAFAGHADVPSALSDPAIGAPPPDEIAMMVSTGHQIFELNLVSSYVWDILDSARSLSEVVDAVVSRFGVDRPTAWGDVARLCDEMTERDLVVVCGQDDPSPA